MSILKGNSIHGICLLLSLISIVTDARGADDFDRFLKPLFARSCIRCHGEKKAKGKVNLEEIDTAKHFLGKPELIEEMIGVIDAADMPPEDEPALDGEVRAELLATLRAMLLESTSGTEVKRAGIRRLNRFQYNNCVKDLFQLKGDVFGLPEKLMTRYGNYLNTGAGRMPDKVEVACLSLKDEGGLKEVKAYPKDLRAAHGFDNQANQLTLSPLLLDAFLRLSVSILENPDFNQGTVGVWNDFFKEPAAGADVRAEVEKRLAPFLERAFRRSVGAATLSRYTAYAMSKIDGGMPFTAGMKRVASAALSSPLFLYRYGSARAEEGQFELASNLSFFLWGSSPDSELLALAGSSELSSPENLNRTVERMIADPKIERFLDTFPSQWMQLENVFAATPDPAKHRLFSLDKNNPAGVHMVLEPLLLFDAVFIEDRSVLDLVSPRFSYQSDFLKTWYTSDLKPPRVDESRIAEENRVIREKRDTLAAAIKATRAEMDALDKATPGLLDKKLATIDLSAGQASWEEAEARAVAEAAELSTWHRIGPFGAGSLDEAHAKAFLDETAVDLQKAHGKLKWAEAGDLVDGKVHALSGANSATYLYRTIQSRSARPLELSLGSDDSFKIWLNGELVTDKKVSRGVAPDQDRVRLDLVGGENKLLMKVANGGGPYGFYFRAKSVTLPGPVVAALKVEAGERTESQNETLARHYRTIAPELAAVRKDIAAKKAALKKTLEQSESALQRSPQLQDLRKRQQEAERRFEDEIRRKVRSRTFERVAAADPRYGGVITSAAMLSMTSGPRRTHPIARGAWIIEVIFNDPPPPPPNDVPPLNEDAGPGNLTIREKFAKHRENPDCAGCHSRLDPLGFALENFDITGRWRDKYENGRDVDPSGTLLRKYEFDGIVDFKESLVKERRRFARAFTGHLLRFALSRELGPADALTVDAIVEKTETEGFKLRSLIREVILSDSFLPSS